MFAKYGEDLDENCARQNVNRRFISDDHERPIAFGRSRSFIFGRRRVSKATNRLPISFAAEYELRKAVQERLVEEANARGLSLQRAALMEIVDGGQPLEPQA